MIYFINPFRGILVDRQLHLRHQGFRVQCLVQGHVARETRSTNPVVHGQLVNQLDIQYFLLFMRYQVILLL